MMYKCPFEIAHISERKKPCLMVWTGKNEQTKVASFNNEKAAEVFAEALMIFMKNDLLNSCKNCFYWNDYYDDHEDAPFCGIGYCGKHKAKTIGTNTCEDRLVLHRATVHTDGEGDMWNKVCYKGYTVAMFDKLVRVYDANGKMVIDADVSRELTEDEFYDLVPDFVQIAESGD